MLHIDYSSKSVDRQGEKWMFFLKGSRIFLRLMIGWIAAGSLWAVDPVLPRLQVTPSTGSANEAGAAANISKSQSRGGGLRAPESYLIQNGDIIRIRLLDEPDFDLQTRVGRDGMITIPYVELVQVGGKTIRDATRMVEKRLKDYYINPLLIFEVAEFAKRQIVVLGQVEHPGMYEVPPLQDTIELMEAIAMAGGASGTGDLGRVTIKRMVGGKEVVEDLDAKSISRNEKGKGFEISPGDTIIVQLSKREFAMLGQIQAPRLYDIPPMRDSIDLMEAIAMAGGASRGGDLGTVTIKRYENKHEKILTYDAKALGRNQKGAERIPVMAGDTVIVQVSRNEYTILGQVRNPGVYEVPALTDSVSVLEAIAMAGGATRLADLGNVTVRRRIGTKDGVLTLNVKEMGRDEKVKIFHVIPGDRIVIGERLF